MSHRKPTKTKFNDDWRNDAVCVNTIAVAPEMKTAWDNIDHGTWEKDDYRPDPLEGVAKNLCATCPVLELCLQDAIKDNESEGIRGGYRFERGTVSKEDAAEIFEKYGFRAKVRKRGNSVQEVQSDE